MSALDLFNKLNRFHNPIDEKSWGTLYSNLFEMPNPPYTTFIKLGYFRNCEGPIDRFQDIPEHYKIYNNPVKIFISHKWETHDHPDISRKTLQQLLSLTHKCNDDDGIWLDYCSLPQPKNSNGTDDLSKELRDFLKFQLTIIPLVILDSQCMFLWSENGLNSGWCCAELLIAQAIMQHLNKLIYAKKGNLIKPPLFVTQIGNHTKVESDLARFDYTLVQKMYVTEVAMRRHDELIAWMNGQLNRSEPIPYSALIKKVEQEVSYKMFSDQKLTFTDPADAVLVPYMLYKIYERLSTEPFTDFKWTGKKDFSSLWHYIKGSLGNCVVPHKAYKF